MQAKDNNQLPKNPQAEAVMANEIYLVFVREDGSWMIRGKRCGYDSFEEAKKVAIRSTDDALPNNHAYVCKVMGYAKECVEGPYFHEMG